MIFFFSDKSKFITPPRILDNQNSYHLYPLRINLNKVNKSKIKIIKEFLKKKIKVQVHYIPVNSQPFYKKKYGFKKGISQIQWNFIKILYHY